MSRREAKKAATLAAICAAARRLFAEKGYAETRTREIAEAAGIATGTLFNYAPTKRDVVLLLWKERAQEALALGLGAAAQAPSEVEACVALVRPVFAFYTEDLELGRVFLDAAVYDGVSDPEIRSLNGGFVGGVAGLLAERLGNAAPLAAMNVFGAYFLVLTMLLSGESRTVNDALITFRMLVRTQADGWPVSKRVPAGSDGESSG